MDSYLVGTVVFIFGSVIGSFLNVCIYRIPHGLSVVSPPSHCPACKTPIRWYQNVPVFGYLFLGGRCDSCGGGISVRYPVVEALTGILFALVWYNLGGLFVIPVYWLFVSSMVVISFIDLDHQIIPDVISLPGIILGFLLSFAVPWVTWQDSILGILLGGGSLYLVAKCYHWLTHVEGMGGGDVKLLAMIGAFLGWKAILPVIFLGSLSGALVGVPLMLYKRAGGKLAIPFGPFLATGAVIYLLFGETIIEWYVSFAFHR